MKSKMQILRFYLVGQILRIDIELSNSIGWNAFNYNVKIYNHTSVDEHN